MLHQIVKVEVYVPEVIQVVSKVSILTKKGTSSDVYLMTHATKNTQNVDEQIILLLSQVS